MDKPLFKRLPRWLAELLDLIMIALFAVTVVLSVLGSIVMVIALLMTRHLPDTLAVALFMFIAWYMMTRVGPAVTEYRWNFRDMNLEELLGETQN